jgi:predicted GIY-YIG superfamily endonuclease
MGIIYLITSPSGKKYIGQTIQPLEKRWKQHIDASKREYKDHCRVLNKSLRKYSDKHFKIEILEECEQEYLDEKELFYIEKYNTIVPNGMNIKKGGSNGLHHSDTKQKISDSLKGRNVSYETRLKLSNKMNPDLPMYMLKIQNGYRICNHPMGPEKKFISKNKTDEYNYIRAVEYLNKLNNLEDPIMIIKSENEKYIQKHKNGYCVKYPSEKPKYFVSRSSSIDELYKNVLSYLNKLKSKSAVQRLNDNG